jgi:hypothetical protein
MVTISAEAFAALKATLPLDREADTRSDGMGGFYITLPRDVLDKLKAMRGPGDRYSDVIVGLARREAARLHPQGSN